MFNRITPRLTRLACAARGVLLSVGVMQTVGCSFARLVLKKSTARSRRRRSIGVAAALLAAQMLADPTRGLAQQAAYANVHSETAQELAQHALECLRRGEDVISPESRLAAYREGREFAERAIAADGKNADAHFAFFANHGRVMLLEGDVLNPFNLIEVNRELERALELNPNHADALAAKGGLYRQLPTVLGGSLTKAETYLTRAIALDPNAVGARIELAETYREMGDPQRGVPLLQKAGEVAEQQSKYRQLGEVRRLLCERGITSVP